MHPSCTLLSISTELLVEIFSHLPATDLFSVQRTCRTIRDIVVGTAYLQYILRTHINGVDDFLPPDFPYSERLELLRRHEQSWDALQFNLITERVANLRYFTDFTFQDGYLIYESLQGSLSRYGYMDLYATARNEELRWVHITMDHSHVPVTSTFTFAVDHDLVVAMRFRVFSNPFLSANP